MNQGSQRINRLRWLCRRGMKELDVMLEAFLRQNNDLLADGGWAEFESLLACEDDLLWDWLQGRAPVTDFRFQELVDAIRLGSRTAAGAPNGAGPDC